MDVALMLTTSHAATQAAKDATTTIPIVFSAADPVGSGLLDSLARPGANLTGVSSLTPELMTKRLELLLQIAPGLTRVAVLWYPTLAGTVSEFRQVERAAQAL